MLSPCVRISQVVLDLPEEVTVVLDAAFVCSTNPAAKVNHRFVTLTLAVADVETDLSMPCKVLDRGDVRKDVSVKLLTIEENVIHHCKSNRVRVGEALA